MWLALPPLNMFAEWPMLTWTSYPTGLQSPCVLAYAHDARFAIALVVTVTSTHAVDARV